MVKKSLAKTDKMYVEVQFRVREDNSLHIQGEGISTNRNYGVAVSFSESNFPKTILNALSHLSDKATLSSKAGSSKKYYPAQFRIVPSTNELNFQIETDDPLIIKNRDYGLAFRVCRTEENKENFDTLSEFFIKETNNYLKHTSKH